MLKLGYLNGVWLTVLFAAIMRAGRVHSRSGCAIGLNVIVASLVLSLLVGCSNLTGWRIPGTEKGVGATTKVYLVLENVETMPEETRTQGEIYVDDAFFGYTSRPSYYRFVGNALVVGEVQIEKDRIHTLRVVFPGYEPFVLTRHFGTLAEYSVPFRLKRLPGYSVVPSPPEPGTEATTEKKWHEFWK